MEDPLQRRKLLRDVSKNIKLAIFEDGGFVYHKGDAS